MKAKWFLNTCVIFDLDIDVMPDFDPDYESKSGSKYWLTEAGVYRKSDHWGGVSSCYWLAKSGDKISDFVDWGKKSVTGFAKWTDFEEHTFSREFEMRELRNCLNIYTEKST